jgi:hypothetical protein
MAKSKLTPEIKDKIGTNITLGMPLKFAAQAAGISESTFYEWMSRGEKEKKGQFSEFSEYIKECQSKAVQLHLKLITKAAKDGSWQASAWILERRHPEEFGRRDRVDLKAESNVHQEAKVVFYLPDNGRDPDFIPAAVPEKEIKESKEAEGI